MSLRDYDISSALNGQGDWVEDFYALIMTAMRNADTFNLEKLKAAFPDTYAEFQARYNAPRGLLSGETDGEGWTRDKDGNLFHPDGQLVRAV